MSLQTETIVMLEAVLILVALILLAIWFYRRRRAKHKLPNISGNFSGSGNRE